MQAEQQMGANTNPGATQQEAPKAGPESATESKKAEQAAPPRNFPRIEDYALLGDCETAALVSLTGSIDWLCWPSFSSGACFAALLGTSDNGHWSLCPAGEFTSTRQYRTHTLVLETTFDVAPIPATEDKPAQVGGRVQVIDFMPIREKHSRIVRIVKGIAGSVPMRMDLALRFDYGGITPWVTTTKDGLKAIAGPDMVLLRTTAPLRGENMTTVSEFNVSAGEEVTFVLSYGASYEKSPRRINPADALVQTEAFWARWALRSSYRGDCAEAVERSLITLKALTYRPTGGVVAAATTSLPEQLGGPRNWDYRFCWLRDTSFMLLVLMDAGYQGEAVAWKQWLLRAVAGAPDQIQTLYGILGERQLQEWEVPWLPGYENSSPVRVGNAASQQFQLDVFGEIASALRHTRHEDGAVDPALGLEAALTKHLEQIWEQPDEGIWEMRNGRQHFTYSKAMAWLAFDCAVKNIEDKAKQAPLDEEVQQNLDRWRKTRQCVHDQVCERGFDTELNSFVQSYGSKQLDASCLLLAMIGFLPPDDPRIRGTVEAIEKHLMPQGYVLRYNTSTSNDGLPPGEGVFLACSFWMVTNLVLLGRRSDAEELFERLMALRNDVGLLAEEYDPAASRQVGNFPQALSHLALISAAFALAQKRSDTSQRAPATPSAK
ncbi:MAG: glycoside hydrolase family 15 protein [Acidobacteriaceae bacterium]